MSYQKTLAAYAARKRRKRRPARRRRITEDSPFHVGLRKGRKGNPLGSYRPF